MSDERNSLEHPIQPVERDAHGVLRFKENAIVKRLLDAGGIDLNDIAHWDVPRNDREQFAMLIGYSVSGVGDLGYVRDVTIAAVERLVLGEESELQARLKAHVDLLSEARLHARDLAATLFSIHEDDLTE